MATNSNLNLLSKMKRGVVATRLIRKKRRKRRPKIRFNIVRFVNRPVIALFLIHSLPTKYTTIPTTRKYSSASHSLSFWSFNVPSSCFLERFLNFCGRFLSKTHFMRKKETCFLFGHRTYSKLFSWNKHTLSWSQVLWRLRMHLQTTASN